MKYLAFNQHLQGNNPLANNPCETLKTEQINDLIQEIPGFVTSERIQLLNLAVSYLEPDEIYCEIGCYQGLSLIAALLNHLHVPGFAIDNFSELNPQENNLEKLTANLDKYGLDQVLFFPQDFESFFAELRGLEVTDKIGVYFYDAAQDYRSQLMGLLLVRPFLADRALIVINASRNEISRQAIWDFLVATPQAFPLLELTKFQHPEYPFLDGMTLLAWDIEQSHTWDWQVLAEHRSPTLLTSLAECSRSRHQESLSNLHTQAVELHANHQYAEGEKKYQQFLLWEYQQIRGWINLGNLYLEQQRYLDALDAFLNGLELDRTSTELHTQLGITFEYLGDLLRAKLAYEEALSLEPKLPQACLRLGNLLLSFGEPSKAESLFHQVCSFNPEDDAGYVCLGDVLLVQIQIEPAIAAYQEALKRKPEAPTTLAKLNLALAAQNNPVPLYAQAGSLAYSNGKFAEAIPHFQAVLRRQPEDSKIANLLAACYRHLNQIPMAIQTLSENLTVLPQSPENHLSLTFLLQGSGETEAAITAAENALLQFPDWLPLQIQARLMLPVIYQQQSELENYRQRFSQGLVELLEQSQRLLADPTAMQAEQLPLSLSASASNMFYLGYQGQNDRLLNIQYGKLIQLLCRYDYHPWMQPLPMPPLSGEGKIRVGYLAPSMGTLFMGWLRHHDRQKLELYCYQLGTDSQDLILEFRQYSDRFYALDKHIATIREKILADRLHILVFPAIGMELEILQLASQQLAPVQCASWLHPVTTGLPTIQYFLSNDLMEPEQAQQHYSENLVRLPNMGISISKPEIPELSKNRADFDIPTEAIMFLCSQNLMKYQPHHDYIFVEIARSVPSARLIFVSHSIQELTLKFKERLNNCFSHYGLEADAYCLVLPRLNRGDYFQVNLLSDIFLDSLGWSGGITTLDSIACNLPIVTCPGETMRSRQSYGMLKILGITETVAQTEDEYIKIAIKLGLDPDWRCSIRTKMQQNSSAIYEDTACVTALEKFYRYVVQEFSDET